MPTGKLWSEGRMPDKKKVAKFVEIPPDVVAAVEALCERHGTTFTFELVDALRRHVAYPPQRQPEPLPDGPAAPPPPPAPKDKRRKRSG